MGKNNPRSAGKKQQELAERLTQQHNSAYMQVVKLYQDTIEELVEDDTPEEKPLRAFIFKKCNIVWVKYCSRNQGLAPRPDPRYFYNTIGTGRVEYDI
jgi:hypothetical protein